MNLLNITNKYNLHVSYKMVDDYDQALLHIVQHIIFHTHHQMHYLLKLSVINLKITCHTYYSLGAKSRIAGLT